MISPSKRPVPTQQTNIHAFSRIRTRDPNNQATTHALHRPVTGICLSVHIFFLWVQLRYLAVFFFWKRIPNTCLHWHQFNDAPLHIIINLYILFIILVIIDICARILYNRKPVPSEPPFSCPASLQPCAMFRYHQTYCSPDCDVITSRHLNYSCSWQKAGRSLSQSTEQQEVNFNDNHSISTSL
jgi:hypothetical protein